MVFRRCEIFPSDADLNATNGISWKAVDIRSFTVILAYIVSHILNIIRTISILGWDCETIIITNYIFHLNPDLGLYSEQIYNEMIQSEGGPT